MMMTQEESTRPGEPTSGGGDGGSDMGGGRSTGLLLVVSGPSGVGKTTIVRQVLSRLGGLFSVSATTRPRRPGETHGVDYFFLTQDEFQTMRENDAFLEYAEVFGSHWYGTPRDAVHERLKDGQLIVLDIDVQGAIQIRERMPRAFMMFIEPPDPEALLTRLRSRGSEDEATIQRRFEEAQREIETARTSGVYDLFLVNDALDTAVDQACEAIRERRDGAPSES